MFFENILPYCSSKPISNTLENKKRHAINCTQDFLSKYKTFRGSVNIFKSHLNIAMTRYTTGFVKRPKHLQRNYVSGRGFYTLICCSFLCDRFQGNSLTVLALLQPWVSRTISKDSCTNVLWTQHNLLVRKHCHIEKITDASSGRNIA